MESVNLSLAQVAPNKTAVEVLTYLWPKFQTTLRNIKYYHLVDTNLQDVTDLTWYLTIDPSQLALFIMTNETFY